MSVELVISRSEKSSGSFVTGSVIVAAVVAAVVTVVAGVPPSVPDISLPFLFFLIYLSSVAMRPFDVFQPGLVRGSAILPHDPEKAYAYVEHPTEGWRVYLRTAIFLYDSSNPIGKNHFLVVKRTGAPFQAPTWEPPKGQMEGSVFRGSKDRTLLSLLKQTALREIAEESFITHVTHLQHTGLIYQQKEKGSPPHHFFQYHIFTGLVSPKQIESAFAMFEWIQNHPKAFARFTRDRKEKDAISWYTPKRTPLNPRWCIAIVRLYLTH